jgi:hypothetical protein
MDMQRTPRPAHSTVARDLFAPSRTCALALTLAILAPLAASAAPVPITNADFSAAANQGSVGGGLVGASGSSPIGAGPWSGSYAGVLGLLAPPTLTIGSGSAQVSDLAVVALGIANRGAFTQTLAAPYVPLKHYVLVADIDVGDSLLGLDLLAGGNAGLALTRAGTTLASTEDAGATSLTLASSQRYHLALGYDSDGGASGDIGVALFADPSGVLGVNLLAEVGFSNVMLTQAPMPALPPVSIGPAGGTPQAATVNSAFAAPLVVSVFDAEGDPLQGVSVTFSAPVSGPGADLSATTLMTDIGGRAQVTGVANASAGSYMIVASVGGVEQAAQFELTNSEAGQPAVTGVHSNGHQSSIVGQTFACMVAVQVIADATPAAGATVVFSAPLLGASAQLSDGMNSGPVMIQTTDANGVAMVAATANGTAGSYDVTALVTSLTSETLAVPVALASWPMTNVAADDGLFIDNFDPVPALCGF